MTGVHGVARRKLARKLESKGIRDPRVLEAIRNVPRDRFVPPRLQQQAYLDHALPIGEGQTISQPWVVARMTELLAPGVDDNVLEIGTGSGYQTAILARLAQWVYSLERIPALARTARQRLRELGVDNVRIQDFDGSIGWSEVGPFDRILVTAAAPAAPEPLLAQLREGGRLVVPEGSLDSQVLTVYDRRADHLERRTAEGVAFVPLVGRFGWPEEGDGQSGSGVIG